MRTKNFLSLLIVPALLFCLAGAVYAETEFTHITVSDADVYEKADRLSGKAAEIYEGTYVRVTETENGFGKISLPAAGVSGWVELSALAELPRARETDIIGIKLVPPKKTTYIDGEERADNTGLEVFALLKNGEKRAVARYNVFMPELKGPGVKTATVTYSPPGTGKTFAASFGITVLRVPVKALELISPPDKTVYIEHAAADFTGLRVRAVFENESDSFVMTAEEILGSPDCTVTGSKGEKYDAPLEEGRHTFSVTYKYADIACSFDINVKPRTLVGLSLKRPPDSLTVYSNAEMPSIVGIVLEAVYDNGEKEELYYYDCEVRCTPADFVLGPGNKAEVCYKNFKITLEFQYLPLEETGIKLMLPKILSFHRGDKIDLSGLRVFLCYNDKSMKEIHDYQMSSFDPRAAGAQNITITYKEFSDVFSIYISEFFGIGDVDGNGEITAADARQALRGAVGLIKLAGLTFNAADADRDGEITAADARKILRAAVGLEKLV